MIANTVTPFSCVVHWACLLQTNRPILLDLWHCYFHYENVVKMLGTQYFWAVSCEWNVLEAKFFLSHVNNGALFPAFSSQGLRHTVWIPVLCAASQWRTFVVRNGRKAWRPIRASETCPKTRRRAKQNNTNLMGESILFYESTEML